MMARPGRPESSIDPGSGPEARFGFALRQLRENAGCPTYRELAARPGVHFSASVLSTAANGKKIPPWEHVRAYVIACEGADCSSALKYWKRQWRRYAAESGEESGVRPDADVLLSMDREERRWRRLLVTVGAVIGVSSAAAFLVSGGTSPPPATRLELGAGCEALGDWGNTAPPVRVPPGYLDGLHYEVGYRVGLRRAKGFQQVTCVVNHEVRSASPGLVTGLFDARVGVPDGLASGTAVTVRIAGGAGSNTDSQTFGGQGDERSVKPGRAFSVRPGQSSESVTFEFATAPGTGEVTVLIADPHAKLLRWWGRG
ncbi:hypothetical protein ACIA5G_24465 [Amycolatopsis sp. NPDC051758]|uniref:hypothetical protein n=1 Tax=Amycolatopsis sp. NPDC051758 TaxID=3363935 RepID=UPI0037B6D85E